MTNIKQWLDDHLIPDWTTVHKKWSVRIAAIGAALKTFALAFPSYASDAWNAIPQDMRTGLPGGILKALPALLFVLVIFARVVPQKTDKTNG